VRVAAASINPVDVETYRHDLGLCRAMSLPSRGWVVQPWHVADMHSACLRGPRGMCMG
jgi:hypothetical protein